MTDIFTPKNAREFNCKMCDFVCSKKSDWSRHILTRKHKNTDKILTNTDAGATKNAALKTFFCECGKKYKHRQSVFNHKKSCEYVNNLIQDNMNNKDLVINLLNQNNQLQNQIIELCKEKNNINYFQYLFLLIG